MINTWNSSFLHPRIIVTIVKIFSRSVVADTLPKPILVIVLSVKYRAVTYLDLRVNDSSVALKGICKCPASNFQDKLYRSQIWFIGKNTKLMQPGYILRDLFARTDKVPEAGEPVSNEHKSGHE